MRSKEWSNWSGSVRFRPERILYPASVEEVAGIIRQVADENKPIRVVGSGHSFTPLVPADILLSLDRLRGLEAVDKERRLVTVRAGTKLKELGELLHGHGLAQENLGDINAQSIAGAIKPAPTAPGRASAFCPHRWPPSPSSTQGGRWSNAPRTEIRSCSRRRRFPSAPWG